jgi:hypothetical protein
MIAHLNDLSGANKALVDLAKGLSKTHDITVVVPRKGALYNELIKNNIKATVILSGTWVYKRDEKLIKKIIKRTLNFFAEIKYRSFFKTGGFDLIHYNSYTYGTGARSASKLGIPYVWHIRELPEENFNLTFFNREKSNRIVSGSECMITISNFMKKAISDRFSLGKISVVYDGISTTKNISSDLKKKELSDIVLIGAIAEDKGTLDAIKAVKYLHEQGIDKKLYIVGAVTDNAYYEIVKNEITEDIKQNIIFVGYKSDLKDYRKKSLLALMCSKAEAFGLVTIEAMNAGQIIIGADTGATPEIINDGYNGFLYRQGDHTDLAKKIIAAFNYPELDRISINAQKTVRDSFSTENNAALVGDVLDSVVRARRKK